MRLVLDNKEWCLKRLKLYKRLELELATLSTSSFWSLLFISNIKVSLVTTTELKDSQTSRFPQERNLWQGVFGILDRNLFLEYFVRSPLSPGPSNSRGALYLQSFHPPPGNLISTISMLTAGFYLLKNALLVDSSFFSHDRGELQQ